ncbi:MAG: tetratricopeptide repeat protein [Bacteroidales bacterium]
MKVQKSIYSYIILALTVLVLFSQCGTKKNTPFRRSYHNLTAYFNILFNGRESFEEGMKRYAEDYQFDYTRRLPIFIYGDEELSENITPQMERTIEKAGKVISLHSITAKPEKLKNKRKLTQEEKEFYNRSEYNKFVDDSYLLMGKAYFWQMDYSTATEIFSYTINNYRETKEIKEARVWLAKSYIERERFRDAEKTLEEIDEIDSLPQKIETELLATYTHFYLKQNNRGKAIDPLKKAIEKTEQKDKKARYTYILAQLYAEEEQHKNAYDTYEKVTNIKPDYAMNFNAKLQKAKLAQLAGIKSEGIKKELEKMLKEDKNEEFKEQIYYALGKIEENNNNINEAINNYKKATQKESKNPNQKGLTYLSLADIYFEDKQYENAQAYYDSAVTSLEKDYPGYTDLYIKNSNLNKLVSNLNTIRMEDSLQKIAQLDERERNTAIDNMIAQYKEEQKNQKEKERQAQQRQTSGRTTQQRDNFQDGSQWYFYSETAVERGKSSFVQKWGERELEDNWRRSQKSSSSFADFTGQENPEELEENEEEQLPKTDRQYYLEKLPLTDSAMEASHKKIQDAYFNVGMIYMNELENNQKAIESFEELNERYKEHPQKLSSFYYLYKLYEEQGNNSKANSYKKKIISEYPESNHAKILEDPNYFKKLEEEQNKAENFYANTLEAYEKGNYNKVIENYKQAKEDYTESKYIPRFEFLRALAIGQTEDIISYRKALEKINKEYPDTEIAESAQNMLAYLDKTELKNLEEHFAANKSRKENKNTQNEKTADEQEEEEQEESKYSIREADNYYCVVVANKTDIDIGRLNFDLINFNLDYFLQKDYSTETRELNDYQTLISIKRFKSLEETKKYYNTLQKREDRVFSEINEKDYSYFYISVKNYLELLENKSVMEYMSFFHENFEKN